MKRQRKGSLQNEDRVDRTCYSRFNVSHSARLHFGIDSYTWRQRLNSEEAKAMGHCLKAIEFITIKRNNLGTRCTEDNKNVIPVFFVIPVTAGIYKE